MEVVGPNLCPETGRSFALFSSALRHMPAWYSSCRLVRNCYKESSPQSAIWCFLFEFLVSSLFLWSSSSCLHLIPCPPTTSMLPSIFPSVTCFRRQFLQKMWPIQLAFLKYGKKKTARFHAFPLTLRRLMSYIYGAPILDVSRSRTTTQHSR